MPVNFPTNSIKYFYSFHLLKKMLVLVATYFRKVSTANCNLNNYQQLDLHHLLSLSKILLSKEGAVLEKHLIIPYSIFFEINLKRKNEWQRIVTRVFKYANTKLHFIPPNSF